MKDPILWLSEVESHDELRNKIRDAIWRDKYPFSVPNAYESFGAFMVDVLTGAPQSLKARLRQVMPVLVLEWQPSAGFDILHNLLVIISRLPCPAAAPNIVWVINHWLDKNNPEHERYVWRCLSALVALVPVQNYLSLFRELIDKPGFAPVCLRGMFLIPGDSYKREAGKFLEAVVKKLQDTEKEEFLREVCEIEFGHMSNEDKKLVLEGYKSLSEVMPEWLDNFFTGGTLK